MIADSMLLSYADSHVASNYVMNFPEYDSCHNDYFIVTSDVLTKSKSVASQHFQKC